MVSAFASTTISSALSFMSWKHSSASLLADITAAIPFAVVSLKAWDFTTLAPIKAVATPAAKINACLCSTQVLRGKSILLNLND